MNDTIICRRLPSDGATLYLTNMAETPQGWRAEWSDCMGHAVAVTRTYAADLIGHVAAWQDRMGDQLGVVRMLDAPRDQQRR